MFDQVLFNRNRCCARETRNQLEPRYPTEKNSRVGLANGQVDLLVSLPCGDLFPFTLLIATHFLFLLRLKGICQMESLVLFQVSPQPATLKHPFTSIYLLRHRSFVVCDEEIRTIILLGETLLATN